MTMMPEVQTNARSVAVFHILRWTLAKGVLTLCPNASECFALRHKVVSPNRSTPNMGGCQDYDPFWVP